MRGFDILFPGFENLGKHAHPDIALRWMSLPNVTAMVMDS
jgi:hypothetical protein